jgi:hypothetical protein
MQKNILIRWLLIGKLYLGGAFSMVKLIDSVLNEFRAG